MNALLWAIPITAAVALALLSHVSPEHAREALNVATGLWIAVFVAFLPLLLTRS